MTNYHLISFALCPYAQRAAIVLREKGVEYRRTDIDLANKPAWFLELSPLGKVPVLVVELDGQTDVLFESAAIAEYLDEAFEPRLHPADLLTRARHRAWIEFASATLADIYAFYTTPDSGVFQAAQSSLRAKFERLEKALGNSPYFAGPHFSLVDAAFAPAFRYFDLFDDYIDHGLFDGLDKLTRWRLSLAARPSVRTAVRGDYLDLLLKFARSKESYLAGLITEAEWLPQKAVAL